MKQEHGDAEYFLTWIWMQGSIVPNKISSRKIWMQGSKYQRLKEFMVVWIKGIGVDYPQGQFDRSCRHRFLEQTNP